MTDPDCVVACSDGLRFVLADGSVVGLALTGEAMWPLVPDWPAVACADRTAIHAPKVDCDPADRVRVEVRDDPEAAEDVEAVGEALEGHAGAVPTTNEFRSLLALAMASDPSPVSEGEDEAVRRFLDREAGRRGYDGWVEAYHEVGKPEEAPGPDDHECRECGARVGPLVFEWEDGGTGVVNFCGSCGARVCPEGGVVRPLEYSVERGAALVRFDWTEADWYIERRRPAVREYWFGVPPETWAEWVVADDRLDYHKENVRGQYRHEEAE